MAVRLGFACAVYVRPDILIVDEALSVGDAYFQNKCLHKIRAMLDQGTSFIYVTHSADSIRSLCNQGLWLDQGRVRLSGPSSAVGGAYQSEIFRRLVRAGLQGDGAAQEAAAAPDAAAPSAIDQARLTAFAERVAALRTGSGEILIDDVVLIDSQGQECDSIGLEEPVRIRVFYHVVGATLEKAVLNVGITDNAGRQILHMNPMFAGVYASDATPQVPQMMELSFVNPLCPGEYGITAGIATLFDHPSNHGQTLVKSVIDYCPDAGRFAVRFPDQPVSRDLWGIVHIDYQVTAQSID